MGAKERDRDRERDRERGYKWKEGEGEREEKNVETPPPTPKTLPKKKNCPKLGQNVSVKTFGQNVIGTQTLNNFYKP